MTYQRIRRYLPLALISFLSVYLELIVIRWLASEVRIFAYFKNFPLLAAFLGFGMGCLIAKRRKGYFKYAPWLLFILSAVICFAYPLGYTHITFVDPFETYLIGTFTFDLVQMLKGAGCVLGIFILTTLLFTTVCEKLGECLEDFPPLTAYTVNVAFSLAGILLYAWMSWMGLGPAIWLAVAACAMAPFFLTLAPAEWPGHRRMVRCSGAGDDPASSADDPFVGGMVALLPDRRETARARGPAGQDLRTG